MCVSCRYTAHAVGNIFSHDNAVVPGERVAQMATAIHRPDVGYSGTQVHPPNISAVIFFREFAAAEAAVGNSSGATALLQVC